MISQFESPKKLPLRRKFLVSDKVAHALSRDVFDVIVVPLTSTKTVSFSQSCCTVYSQVICGSYLGYNIFAPLLQTNLSR